MPKLPFIVLLVLSGILTTRMIGCSRPAPGGDVFGTISVNQSPVPGGARVALMNFQTGFAAAASITPESTFHFQELVPVGKYVLFVVEELEQEVPPDGEARPKSAPVSQNAALRALKKKIPSKYWDEVKSDVFVDVHVGENKVNFDIASAT